MRLQVRGDRSPRSPRRLRRRGVRALTARTPVIVRGRVRCAAGRRTVTARPPSALRSARDLPRIASTRPRTTLRPMPSPRREPSPRVGPRGRSGRTGSRAHAAGTPGPPSSTTSRTSRRRRWRGSTTGASAGADGRATFSSRFVTTMSRSTASARTGGRFSGTSIETCARRGRPEPVDDRPDHGPQLVRLEVRMEAAGGDPAEVEETADETIEPGCLGIDARCAGVSPASSVQRPSGSARPPAVARMLASGVRRSCETESMRAVFRASAWRAISSVRGRLSELVAPERQRELVGGEREDARRAPCPGGPAARSRGATMRAEERPSETSIRTRYCDGRAVDAGRRARPGPWVRTQRAGSSPGRPDEGSR